jgi:hypothetical protein
MERMQLQAERFEVDETWTDRIAGDAHPENQCVHRCEVRRLLRVSLSVIPGRAFFARTRNPETVRRCWIPGLRPRERIPE